GRRTAVLDLQTDPGEASASCRLRHYHKYQRIERVAPGRPPAPAGCRQEPRPGFSEKYFSNLPSSRSKASASAGGSPLTVMLGQVREYSELTFSHLPSGSSSVSGLIASTGHSGSQTPQSMHSSGLMTRKFSPS